MVNDNIEKEGDEEPIEEGIRIGEVKVERK